MLLVVPSYFSLQLLVASNSSAEPTAAKTIESVVNGPEKTVLFIYPESDKKVAKASGVAYPSEEDFSLYVLAGDILLGMTKNSQLSTTDAASYVDRQDGKPQFDGTIVVVGNSQINAVARYYEGTNQTPLFLVQDKTSLAVRNLTGTLESTRTSQKAVGGPSSDIFVIETFSETQNRNVMMLWGLAGRGAIAAARVVKFNIYADPEKYASGWYVGRWTDAKEGSSRNGIPDQGDTYEILYSSRPASTTEGYRVGWTEVAQLYTVGLILAALGYAVRKGWIAVEIQTERE